MVPLPRARWMSKIPAAGWQHDPRPPSEWQSDAALCSDIHRHCRAGLCPPSSVHIHSPTSTTHSLPSAVHRLRTHSPSSTVHRPPSTVHRPPSIVHRSSFIVHRSSFIVHRPSFIVHRPPSTVHRPPSKVHHLPPAVRRPSYSPGSAVRVCLSVSLLSGE